MIKYNYKMKGQTRILFLN